MSRPVSRSMEFNCFTVIQHVFILCIYLIAFILHILYLQCHFSGKIILCEGINFQSHVPFSSEVVVGFPRPGGTFHVQACVLLPLVWEMEECKIPDFLCQLPRWHCFFLRKCLQSNLLFHRGHTHAGAQLKRSCYECQNKTIRGRLTAFFQVANLC